MTRDWYWKGEEGCTTEFAERAEEDQGLKPLFRAIIFVVAEATTHRATAYFTNRER